MDSNILMLGMNSNILRGIAEAVCTAGVWKKKAAIGITKEIITVKYFASNYFVSKFFRVGDDGLYFRIMGNTNLK